jgi:hypothetical protein
MDLNSPLFDRVRTRQRCEPATDSAAADPVCGHPGCKFLGPYRAPQGRGREGQYFNFCLDHVREYNASYNYFKDMSDDAVAAYQKADLYGHRPTWRMGVNGAAVDAGEKLRGAFGPVQQTGLLRACAGGEARRAAGRQCHAQGARHARPRPRRRQGSHESAL